MRNLYSLQKQGLYHISKEIIVMLACEPLQGSLLCPGISFFLGHYKNCTLRVIILTHCYEMTCTYMSWHDLTPSQVTCHTHQGCTKLHAFDSCFHLFGYDSHNQLQPLKSRLQSLFVMFPGKLYMQHPVFPSSG